MPRGDKSKYTDKQKRQAEHIEESYEKKGVSEDESESRAWATVNKQDGGGKQSGSGRKKSDSDKNAKDAPDRDSSATKGNAGTRPPSDS
jgi:plasmid stabilization system protein ParE